jgi:S1-C subfamily serine protease
MHVVGDAKLIGVVTPDKLFIVTTYTWVAGPDLVLLTVKDLGLPAIKMAASMPEVGETVYTLGCPLGYPGMWSTGTANGMVNVGEPYFAFTAPISPGNSGGALLNNKGELIGITTASMVRGQNFNLAVDINQVKAYVEACK